MPVAATTRSAVTRLGFAGLEMLFVRMVQPGLVVQPGVVVATLVPTNENSSSLAAVVVTLPVLTVVVAVEPVLEVATWSRGFSVAMPEYSPIAIEVPPGTEVQLKFIVSMPPTLLVA